MDQFTKSSCCWDPEQVTSPLSTVPRQSFWIFSSPSFTHSISWGPLAACLVLPQLGEQIFPFLGSLFLLGLPRVRIQLQDSQHQAGGSLWTLCIEGYFRACYMFSVRISHNPKCLSTWIPPGVTVLEVMGPLEPRT